MNAALLLMSSTLMAGADAPAAAAPPAPPPAVVAGSGGCGPGCSTGYGPVYGGCCDPCAGGGKVGLLDRLKARFGGRKHKGHDCGCEPAPAPCTTCQAPPPPPPVHHCATCAPAPACTDCATARPNLFDRLKGLCKKKSYAPVYAPACDTCATAPVGPSTVPATPGTDTPKEMPKPTPKIETPKVNPKGSTSSDGLPSITIPSPGAAVIPTSPVTPVSGPKLTGATSPY